MKPNDIYLGDSYKLIKDIPDKSVDLIYTDIPYLIEQGGTKTISNRIIMTSLEAIEVLRVHHIKAFQKHITNTQIQKMKSLTKL